ncbi:hypothetical protein Hdeb2414_s0014g00421821 [Helianthus debilis subsp. tardiflorus]
MADSVDVAPPDSWEVADVDAAVSRLMLSSKRESNNSSPNLTTGSSSEINSDLLAPMRSSSGGVLEDLVNTVDQFLPSELPEEGFALREWRSPSYYQLYVF